MATQKYKRSKVKGPNKLVTLLMFAVIGLVLYYQWDPIKAYVLDVTGWYGGKEGVQNAEFRRVSSLGKTAVARYWVLRGNPPNDNLTASLEPPESYKAGSLLRMEVTSGGVIVFTFDKSSGVHGGTVRLVPDATQLMQNVIKWSCETSDYPHFIDCKYKPPGG